MDRVSFTFSDTIAGYVSSGIESGKMFSLKTSDDREFQVKLTDTTYAEIVQNLDEPFQATGGSIESMLIPGRYLFAYGIFYPETDGLKFEAKRLIFVGQHENEYRFEGQDWWIRQVRSLAEFYFNAEFPDGDIDYCNYRTHLTLEGQKIESTRQETDTISRMIYGFATAYLMTGEDRYLEAAEKGTEYLRENMRSINESEDIVYWYHAMDLQGEYKRKILSSEFGDDYNTIPAYEQIYALAGPVQTYRVTGDPRILRDADMTINLFNKFFLDREKGGYFSHIDPVTFDPRAESLGQDRALKNWNSLGDHAPAYLINLWLSTGEDKYADFLLSTADTIEQRFPDDEHSPFVQERFHEDWSPDTTWNWQQNRAVIGHNLKIAWNLMRILHLRPDERSVTLAKKIAKIMPTVGMDLQRAGWYDVIERLQGESEEWHRLIWHDRKAWWQQEQAILAYLILYGNLKEPEYLQLARESSAFYNAFFLDHDNGGVYFNVLANGIPYLVGTERLKGSHSMSGYHSFELCYLASVYTNLLIMKQPMDFYFKPGLNAFKDNILRVQPDILPVGSVLLDKVWINESPYDDFDAVAMTVKLPSLPEPQNLSPDPDTLEKASLSVTAEQNLRVRVRLVPTGMRFDVALDMTDGIAHLTLSGHFDDDAIIIFRTQLDKVITAQPKRLVLHMKALKTISETLVRELSLARQRLALHVDIYIVSANMDVKGTLQSVGVWEDFYTTETYDDAMEIKKSS